MRNVALGVMGGAVTFVIVTPLSLLAAEHGPGWRENLPLLLRVPLDLLALELFIYWWHRANHESAFLWRLHRVHHYDRFLDVTSAVRFHPAEIVLSAAVRSLYVLLLDISWEAIIVFDAAVVIAAGFHHANLRLPEEVQRRLRRIIVTPSHHRVHHLPAAAATASNYGTLTVLGDRFFGSYRTEGVDGRYGVSGEAEKRLLPLLRDPFR